MIRFVKVVKAEAVKQLKNQIHNFWVVFSMLIWPVLAFASTYYQFKPFKFEGIWKGISYLDDKTLITYIMIGYFAMVFFRSFVQSAWGFSFERVYGTLELIYLSPANRLAVILGNAVAGLGINVWMFTLFSLGIYGLYNQVPIANYPVIAVSMLLMIVMSIIWGMLLNAMFLFTRDSGMLFTILEEPMELFAGVKIPTVLFPLWAKSIGMLFPLTYAIKLLREVVFTGCGFYEIQTQLCICSLICLIMLVMTVTILNLGEKHNTKTGDMALF